MWCWRLNPGLWSHKASTVVHSHPCNILVNSLITFWCAYQISMSTYWHVNGSLSYQSARLKQNLLLENLLHFYDYIWLRISGKVSVEQELLSDIYLYFKEMQRLLRDIKQLTPVTLIDPPCHSPMQDRWQLRLQSSSQFKCSRRNPGIL